MSDARPPEETDEVEALSESATEGSTTNDDERPVPEPAHDSGIDADREVDLGDGEPESAGTGDPSGRPELDAPD